MNKIKRTLKAIGQVFRNPWLLNNILDDNLTWKKFVDRKFGLGKGLPVINFNDLFEEIDETLSPMAFLDGSSLPTDFALLKGLARSFPSCCYFEIGTWRGESVANVASIAKECFTLNLSGEEMRQMGLSDRYINLHGFFSQKLSNVIHLEGNTKSFNFSSLNKKFDLVFIDGDHRYEFVKNDTEKIFKYLVHEGSIIVWHDYMINPEKIRYEVLAGIIEGLPEISIRNLYHVTNTLCAIYLPYQKKAHAFESPVIPQYYFDVGLKMIKN